MSVRVPAAAQFVTEDSVAGTTAARVLGVPRQAVYDRMAPAVQADRRVAEESAKLRLVPPVLPTDWRTWTWGQTSAI